MDIATVGAQTLLGMLALAGIVSFAVVWAIYRAL